MSAETVGYLGSHDVIDGSFVARLLDASASVEMSESQRLRYEYFCKQRGWVQECAGRPGHDIDIYDSASYHLGVFHEMVLLAYLRALPWQGDLGFMLDHEFRCLVPGSEILNRENSLEVSRLVLLPELTGDTAVQVTELLFKLLYQLSRDLQKEHLYIVVEAGWIRRFRHCFRLTFDPLGPTQRFPDGTRTIAAHASIPDLERALMEKAPDKLCWYHDAHTQSLP